MTMTSQVMSPERFRALISNTNFPVEHRALWALLWDGELRLSDALSIDVRDIDLKTRTAARVEVPVRDSGPMAAPMSAEAAELVRGIIGDRAAGPLLVNAGGRPLSREAVSRWARMTGFGIHGFRAAGRKARAHQQE